MREHLYRGKCTESGKWFYGSLIKTRNNECLIVGDWDYGFIFEKCIHRVIPETVGLYTGQKDKNGARIFEGDILECLRNVLEINQVGNKQKCRTKTEKFRHVVYFDYGRFYALQESLFDKVIVGNIHDNPDLFEAAK